MPSASTPAWANFSSWAPGGALFISEAMVKTHLSRIYGKLDVDTRAGAVAVAKEQRLLD